MSGSPSNETSASQPHRQPSAGPAIPLRRYTLMDAHGYLHRPPPESAQESSIGSPSANPASPSKEVREPRDVDKDRVLTAWNVRWPLISGDVEQVGLHRRNAIRRRRTTNVAGDIQNQSTHEGSGDFMGGLSPPPRSHTMPNPMHPEQTIDALAIMTPVAPAQRGTFPPKPQDAEIDISLESPLEMLRSDPLGFLLQRGVLERRDSEDSGDEVSFFVRYSPSTRTP
ncbi:uncharacterized protein F4822DRAFT_432273 [Hypoxylon trugodes]|uniref:uncharacterized protein n=1 Tax=Hypoxylon trugodes TaxID=326681 RepID=UPI002195F2DA|nr:uncharacterized protein F4822DRAFT_432273 [Hypoxylon trugodes]KAI1385422.1 hypothetical protein F4822DRAFT_432273 [Hypoxylon trugodes]